MIRTACRLLPLALLSLGFITVGHEGPLRADAAGVSEEVLGAAVERVLAVDVRGQGNKQASEAWPVLARADAAQTIRLLAALDRANPLAANWLRAAIDSVCERVLREGGTLPVARLEAFVLDTTHAPRGRRLAYEWLVRADPTATDRLTPRMLDDPSTELRRDAVARLIASTEEQYAETGDRAARRAGLRLALSKARDLDQIESVLRELKKLEVEVDEAALFGYVTRWKVIGPFDNTEERGFAAVYPPEREIDTAASYQGKNGRVAWKEHATAHPRGVVDFNALFGQAKSVCGYALAEFECAEPSDAQVRVQTFNAVKVWVNGREVAAHEFYHGGAAFDQYIAPVRLEKGRNTILVKLCQNNQPQSWAEVWEFQLRVTDKIGGAIASKDETEESSETR